MIDTRTLRHILDYEPDTGLLKWRVSYHAKVQPGRVAGSNNRGYVMIKINNKNHSAHRLAWQHFHGVTPKGVVDHVNRNRSDNRITNLRDTGRLENSRNRNPTLFRLSNYGDPMLAYEAFCNAARNRFGDKAVVGPLQDVSGSTPTGFTRSSVTAETASPRSDSPTRKIVVCGEVLRSET